MYTARKIELSCFNYFCHKKSRKNLHFCDVVDYHQIAAKSINVHSHTIQTDNAILGSGGACVTGNNMLHFALRSLELELGG